MSLTTQDRIQNPPVPDYLAPIASELSQVDETISSELDSGVKMVRDVTGHILDAGGKRLRPSLVLLSGRACLYDCDDSHLIRVAAVAELIHMATLLHDDVIDDAESRRGRITANRFWGNQVSVLTGDYMLARAFSLLAADGDIALLAHKNEKILISYMGSDLLGDVNRRGRYTLFGKILVAINKYFADKYDYVIVKSQQLSETLKPGVNHDIIPNGVDLDTFTEKIKSAARTSLKIPEDQKLILFVADPPRLEKNFKLARESIKLLNDDSIMFTVVSGIPKDRLVLFYNAADVLLLTSIHEGSPNNIKEAMACNCPIVATDVGDVQWVIGNTDGCYLASSAPDDIANKLALALEFSKKYGRTTGRDRIVELGLDSNTIARKIISVYHHLLSRDKR